MSSSITKMPAVALAQALAQGEFTSRQITESYLQQIDQFDVELGAFLKVDHQSALRQADKVDQQRKAGKPFASPLAGIPVAIKDILTTKGEATTCASKMLENFVPPYDATVIRKLKESGAVLIGKLNMDEFAMGSTTENSAFQKTYNPWNYAEQEKYTPGGSSGGSAAAVAARMAPLSLGTDTGGSIRQPAAFCGICGLKPTYGSVSRYGLIAFASSLDQIGPFATSAEDIALLFEAIAGHDPQDSTSQAATEVPDFTLHLSQAEALLKKPLKIGVVRDHFTAGLDSEVEQAVRAAIDVYRDLGAEVVEVDLPHQKYAIATYYIVASCEASSNLARHDGVHYGHRANEETVREVLAQQQKELKGTGGDLEMLDSLLVQTIRMSRSEGFGPEVQRRIMLGTYALSSGYYDAYYLKALKVRRLIQTDYLNCFKEQGVDLLLGPTTPTTSFEINQQQKDPLALYLGDLYTVGANLAGLPGLSIPCGFSEKGLPIGLQLTGPSMSEVTLLGAAHLYQRETTWHQQMPAWLTTPGQQGELS